MGRYFTNRRVSSIYLWALFWGRSQQGPSPPLSPQTTFIKSLLGRDYPGSHIGPEPTTDRFVVVYHGMEERRVPGNTLAVQKDLPYQGLSSFGTGFLSRCGEVWKV